MPDRELLVRIVGDDRSLQQAFARSSRGAQQFENRTSVVGKNLTRGFAAAGIAIGVQTAAQFTNQLVQAASDLNEEITKSQKVFGDSADEIRDWSETTASSIGISQTAALQATGIFGNLFNTVGLGTQQSAEMSKSLTTLAADLASFNNASIEDTLDAIRSGLIGEAEPLRRYGVLLSEARVQQVAMQTTGKASASALTDQEKALARYKIILQDTIPAQGDFADTSEGLANQQRIAAAEAQNLAATIGQALAPGMQVGLAATIGLVGGLNNLIRGMKGVRENLHDSHFADGFNSAVDGAATHASNFFLGLRDGIPFLKQFRGEVQGLLADTQTGTPGATGDSGPHAGQNLVVGREKNAAAADAADAKNAAAVIARIQREAAARARAQRDFNLALANSETRAAHLRELLREDPNNARLQARYTAELATQNRLRQQIASNAAATAASDAAAAAARRADAAEAAKAAREARQAAIQGRQFEALGLTSEGLQRVPGIGALRRRGARLEDQIQGTTLDTAATRSKLQRIARVLSGQFGQVGRDVRQAILSMFNEISSALDQGTDSVNKGPRTRFRVANTSNVLAGLGLSEDQEKALRSRLSRIGAGGTTSQTSDTGGAFGVNVAGGGNIVINGDVNVHADSVDEFGQELEKKGRRNGSARTGRFAGHKN